MDNFTFLHAADIHLDSPLLSLVLAEPRQVERMRRACRETFGKLVDTAIERKVAFVILAGDLYDHDVPCPSSEHLAQLGAKISGVLASSGG
jgi:exonuclease SbcD